MLVRERGGSARERAVLRFSQFPDLVADIVPGKEKLRTDDEVELAAVCIQRPIQPLQTLSRRFVAAFILIDRRAQGCHGFRRGARRVVSSLTMPCRVRISCSVSSARCHMARR